MHRQKCSRTYKRNYFDTKAYNKRGVQKRGILDFAVVMPKYLLSL